MSKLVYQFIHIKPDSLFTVNNSKLKLGFTCFNSLHSFIFKHFTFTNFQLYFITFGWFCLCLTFHLSNHLFIFNFNISIHFKVHFLVFNLETPDSFYLYWYFTCNPKTEPSKSYKEKLKVCKWKMFKIKRMKWIKTSETKFKLWISNCKEGIWLDMNKLIN